MSKLKVFLFFLVMALMSQVVLAGDGTWASVTVTQISPCTPAVCNSPNGFVEVQFSANSTGGPACATTKNWTVINVTTAAGAFAAAVLQSARLSGTTVTATGAGSCLTTGIETLGIVQE